MLRSPTVEELAASANYYVLLSDYPPVGKTSRNFNQLYVANTHTHTYTPHTCLEQKVIFVWIKNESIYTDRISKQIFEFSASDFF